MTPTDRSNDGLSVDVRAAFGERAPGLPALTAYAFSQGGALLAMKPLDDKGNATLVLRAGREAQAVRVVLGPEVEKDALNVAEVLRRGGVERHLALRPGAERAAPLDFALGPDVQKRWIGRLCRVKGTLNKRVVSGGVTLLLPVCKATVDIHEVDPWPLILPRLPELDIDRLRDIVDGPWPPVDLPIPPRPPEWSIGDLLGDPASRVGLNPQPLPPKAQLARLAPGAAQGFNPQPDPPRLLPSELVLAARAPRAAFERAIAAHLDLLRPVLCWLYPRAVTWTRIASVTTDDCGHFSALIWRSLADTDVPDLYFTARQRVIANLWMTIHAPTPVGCHTHWNYVCGTEVQLVTTHPLARTCPPCPPIVAPNNWVLFMAIGNSSVWRIHGANDATAPGTPGFDAAKRGLIDDSAPWGGTLRPRLEFDDSLRATLGVRYYRVSYKRSSEPATMWRPSTAAINRHYTHEVGGDLILEQYPLGPTTVGPSAHLYEIPPALPPLGQWSTPDVVQDTQSAVFPTTEFAPGTGFDAGGLPVGADEGGLWQIRVELFDAAGTRVDPEALGIRWRVPASASLTGTINTRDAAALGLVDTVNNAMIVTVRVDNNPCAAAIGAPAVDGSTAADACGVMNYGARSQTVTLPYTALQRNAFAQHSFYVQRGAVSPPELSRSGAAAPSLPAMPAAPTSSVGDLLDDCTLAGFTEQLYVAHMATDGWSRQSQYDASAVRAFVLAPILIP